MDLIGEIKPSFSKSHRYILVGLDYFTKWVEVVPLECRQEVVINFIQSNIISRFVILETITIDKGSVFTRRKMVEFTSGIGIKLLTSTPYYVEANRQAEVANKVIISLIKKHVCQKQKKIGIRR